MSNPKWLYRVLAGLVVVGCGYAGIQLLHRNQTTPYIATHSGEVPARTIFSQEPSNAEEQKLQTALGGIAGLEEVAMASTPQGITVTATVSAPYGVEPTTNSVPAASLMRAYLADVFEADPLVKIAQLYFVEDGQLVAGGGLSRDAYQKWTVGTMANGGATALLHWMASLTPIGSATADTGWFETGVPVPDNPG